MKKNPRLLSQIKKKQRKEEIQKHDCFILLANITLFPKRNATLISGFFMVTLDQGQFGPNFTDLHSSPKERQLQKSCVSFGEECIKWCVEASASRALSLGNSGTSAPDPPAELSHYVLSIFMQGPPSDY